MIRNVYDDIRNDKLDYPIKEEDVKYGKCYLVKLASDYNRINIVKEFLNYDLNKDELFYCYTAACEKGYLELLKLFISHFNLQKEDLYLGYHFAYRHHQINILDFLEQNYDFDLINIKYCIKNEKSMKRLVLLHGVKLLNYMDEEEYYKVYNNLKTTVV